MPQLQPLLELYIPVPHRHLRKLLLDPSGTRPRHSNAIGAKLRFRKHRTFLVLIFVVTEPDDVPNVIPVGSCAPPDQVLEKSFLVGFVTLVVKESSSRLLEEVLFLWSPGTPTLVCQCAWSVRSVSPSPWNLSYNVGSKDDCRRLARLSTSVRGRWAPIAPRQRIGSLPPPR